MGSFIIDGNPYDIPTFDTFDMDEAQVFYDNCGFPIEDLVLAGLTDDEIEVKFRNPAVIRTLMQVAYQRGNPTVPRQETDKLLRGSNYAEALAAVLGVDEEEETDEDPPVVEEPVNSASDSSSGSSNAISGNGSKTGSEERAATPAPTGIIG